MKQLGNSWGQLGLTCCAAKLLCFYTCLHTPGSKKLQQTTPNLPHKMSAPTVPNCFQLFHFELFFLFWFFPVTCFFWCFANSDCFRLFPDCFRLFPDCFRLFHRLFPLFPIYVCCWSLPTLLFQLLFPGFKVQGHNTPVNSLFLLLRKSKLSPVILCWWLVKCCSFWKILPLNRRWNPT